jgi:SAM-dependent methyltransferase
MSQLMENMVKDGHLGGYVHGGDPGTWCPALWQWAMQTFQVRSVLDVGCGEGHSTRYFLEHGCEILGVEGCPQAIANTAIPGHVAGHDFTHGPFLPPQSFDLVWSCEFLEHVESQYEDNILQTFAHAGKAILVTHAFPGQTDGHHHVNCRPSSYWIRRIESLGFRCDVALTFQARTATLQDYHSFNHFARSGLVFMRDAAPRRTGFGAWLQAQVKAWQIHWGFRWSNGYSQQKRRKKQSKRAAQKA